MCIDYPKVFGDRSRTKITVLIHLNECRKGCGHTTFYLDHNTISINPKAGLMVAFTHQIKYSSILHYKKEHLIKTNIIYKPKIHEKQVIVKIKDKEFAIPFDSIEQFPNCLLYTFIHSKLNTGKNTHVEFPDRDGFIFEKYIFPVLMGKYMHIDGSFSNMKDQEATKQIALKEGLKALPESMITRNSKEKTNHISREIELKWIKDLEDTLFIDVDSILIYKIMASYCTNKSQIDEEFKFWGLVSPFDIDYLRYYDTKDVEPVLMFLEAYMQYNQEKLNFKMRIMQIHKAHSLRMSAFIPLDH